MTDSEFSKLLQFFPQNDFSGESEHYFRDLWQIKTFKQYDLITEAGRIENFFYYVLEGVQAVYLVNEKGEKVVLGFSYSGSPSGVFDSFVNRKPATLFLEALKPSKLLAISYTNYQRLFQHYPKFHEWGHEFFKAVLLGRLSREVELLTLNAQDRYISFMKRCPDELKIIPQKYLASYLNMKPETFSRLRASVSY
ncbi:MAG: Crp/Fnr family transcriptional regulator [Maribacter sp.]|uniref:Crp/Fnr family transcriptional regulator n=1 Tax=Maribacter sp. TaxID=1897614 RepID=UPI003299F665